MPCTISKNCRLMMTGLFSLAILLLLQSALHAQSESRNPVSPGYKPHGATVEDSLRAVFFSDINSSLAEYSAIYNNLARFYVDEIELQAAGEAAIRGLLAELDPYSTYLIDEKANSIEEQTKGRYGGLGFEVGELGVNKRITVVSPFEGTPAWEAGFQPGDVIYQVDDKLTAGHPLSDVITWIKGPPGSEVRITLMRPGNTDLLDFTLERALIEIKDVRLAEIIDASTGIAYIRLSRFSGLTGENMYDAIMDLQEQGMQKLILDLRGNPGGLLREAVKVADLFLPQGSEVVSTQGRTSRATKSLKTHAKPYFNGDLVVLISKGSASASEIVSGALQDYDRAVLIGETTFGKGLVQSVAEINETSKLKFTTARYYLPSGRLIQKKDYFTDNKVLLAHQDSTKADTLFYTASGRLVKSGRGVEPDITVEADFIPWVVTELWRQRKFSSFISDNWNDYKNRETSDSDLLSEFADYIADSEFEFKPRGSKMLEELTKLMKEEAVGKDAKRALKKLQSAMGSSLDQQLKQHDHQIVRRLRLELARQQGGSEARARVQLEEDDTFKAAMALLREDRAAYSSLLVPSTSENASTQ
jgi:carboxyl-terminal processing protease